MQVGTQKVLNKLLPCCRGLNVCVSQNVYVEVLISHVMVFGGEGFGRYLGLEGGALMTGMGALVRRHTGEMISV